MRHLAVVAGIWLLAFGAAIGEPIAEPGSKSLCADFDEVIEGVWMDDGKPALLFRIARNDDDTGCYAWLNAYQKWNTLGPGTIDPGPIRKSENQWRSGNGALFADITKKTALYDWQGAKAEGQLFD